MLRDFKQSVLISLWFVLLTFPLMAVRVNTTDQIVTWRLMNMVWVAYEAFILSWFWRFLMTRKATKNKSSAPDATPAELVKKDLWVQNNLILLLLVLSQVIPVFYFSVVDHYPQTFTKVLGAAVAYLVFSIALRRYQFFKKRGSL